MDKAGKSSREKKKGLCCCALLTSAEAFLSVDSVAHNNKTDRDELFLSLFLWDFLVGKHEPPWNPISRGTRPYFASQVEPFLFVAYIHTPPHISGRQQSIESGSLALVNNNNKDHSAEVWWGAGQSKGVLKPVDCVCVYNTAELLLVDMVLDWSLWRAFSSLTTLFPYVAHYIHILRAYIHFEYSLKDEQTSPLSFISFPLLRDCGRLAGFESIGGGAVLRRAPLLTTNHQPIQR